MSYYKVIRISFSKTKFHLWIMKTEISVRYCIHSNILDKYFILKPSFLMFFFCVLLHICNYAWTVSYCVKKCVTGWNLKCRNISNNECVTSGATPSRVIMYSVLVHFFHRLLHLRVVFINGSGGRTCSYLRVSWTWISFISIVHFTIHLISITS